MVQAADQFVARVSHWLDGVSKLAAREAEIAPDEWPLVSAQVATRKGAQLALSAATVLFGRPRGRKQVRASSSTAAHELLRHDVEPLERAATRPELWKFPVVRSKTPVAEPSSRRGCCAGCCCQERGECAQMAVAVNFDGGGPIAGQRIHSRPTKRTRADFWPPRLPVAASCNFHTRRQQQANNSQRHHNKQELINSLPCATWPKLGLFSRAGSWARK